MPQRGADGLDPRKDEMKELKPRLFDIGYRQCVVSKLQERSRSFSDSKIKE